MIYCKIEDSVVVSRATFDGDRPEGWGEGAVWVPHALAQIGWGYVNGVFVPPPAAPAEPGPTLAQEQARLCALIDDDAEAIRGKYATTQAGMVMTYQEKFAQANAVDQMGEAAANALTPEQAKQSFPVLAASVGIEADTLFQCAAIVIVKYNQFATLAHEIERTRLGAKKAINDSASVEAAQAAYEAVQWTV